MCVAAKDGDIGDPFPTEADSFIAAMAALFSITVERQFRRRSRMEPPPLGMVAGRAPPLPPGLLGDVGVVANMGGEGAISEGVCRGSVGDIGGTGLWLILISTSFTSSGLISGGRAMMPERRFRSWSCALPPLFERLLC